MEPVASIININNLILKVYKIQLLHFLVKIFFLQVDYNMDKQNNFIFYRLFIMDNFLYKV